MMLLLALAGGALATRASTDTLPYRTVEMVYTNAGLALHGSNLVARWEYRPGSTLFVVWTQGRDLEDSGSGPLRVGSDLSGLFARPPQNVVAVKLSYWLSPH